MFILFGFVFTYRWLQCAHQLSYAIQYLLYDHLFDIYYCVYVNSQLLISPTCFWRLGALQRATGTPGSLWRYTACNTLSAPSAPGHSSLGTQANQAPGMWHQLRSLWPERNKINIFFCFYPTIWTEVNYNLVGFFVFSFQSTASWFSWWPEVSFLNLWGCVSLGKNFICIHF